MSDNFPFKEGDFDEAKIVFEEMAKIMAPLFRSLTKAGLSGQEAAALTAAFFQQQIPIPFSEPMED